MAKQPMLKFTNVERDMPEKRPPNLRREDFKEIYAEYADAKAKEQSSRCSQCGLLIRRSWFLCKCLKRVSHWEL